jgi:hypothetical protein
MRRASFFAAVLAFGCDDPEVQGKALELLEFGAVQAKVVCTGVQVHLFDACGATDLGDGWYAGHRLADGSGIVTIQSRTFVIGRSEPGAAGLSVVPTSYPLSTISVGDGFLTVSKDGCSDITKDLETCTGFNLENFGVD